ncbi:MAG: FkbM family methyltransferase [Rhizomicrobium sp.]|nr:FkbM family methyltransferase [Rhizomicrobium sp.]
MRGLGKIKGRIRRFLRRHFDYPPCWRNLLCLNDVAVRTILDIGAFDGDTAKLFRRRFPQAVIHCFEPHPIAGASLRRWAARYPEQVHCYEIGLGAQDGLLVLQDFEGSPRFNSFQTSLPDWHSHLAMPQPAKGLELPIHRLDDWARDHELPGPLLVKIDTEGFEEPVLRGGAEVLRQAAACIIEIQVDRRFANQLEFREVITVMEGFGLHYAGNLAHGIMAGRLHHFDALFLAPDRCHPSTASS